MSGINPLKSFLNNFFKSEEPSGEKVPKTPYFQEQAKSALTEEEAKELRDAVIESLVGEGMERKKAEEQIDALN